MAGGACAHQVLICHVANGGARKKIPHDNPAFCPKRMVILLMYYFFIIYYFYFIILFIIRLIRFDFLDLLFSGF